MQHETIRNAVVDVNFDSIRYEYLLDHNWRAARISLSAIAELDAHRYEPELATFATHQDMIYESTVRKALAQGFENLLLCGGDDVRHCSPPSSS